MENRFEPESAVFIEAEGKTEQIELFKAWSMEMAQKYAKGKIEIDSKKKLKGYTEFNIVD